MAPVFWQADAVVDINDHRSHATIGGVAGSMVSGTVYITEVIAVHGFDGIGSAMSFMTFVLVTIVVLFCHGHDGRCSPPVDCW